MTEHKWIYLPELPEDGHFVWLCPKDRVVVEALFFKQGKLAGYCHTENVPIFVEFISGTEATSYLLGDIECWMPYFTPEPPK